MVTAHCLMAVPVADHAGYNATGDRVIFRVAVAVPLLPFDQT